MLQFSGCRRLKYGLPVGQAGESPANPQSEIPNPKSKIPNDAALAPFRAAID
jgi:hypothetical protein